MLVLSRKKDEIVCIKFGEIVAEVMLIEIKGDKVRLGFTAPMNVEIQRKEIYNEKYGTNTEIK